MPKAGCFEQARHPNHLRDCPCFGYAQHRAIPEGGRLRSACPLRGLGKKQESPGFVRARPGLSCFLPRFAGPIGGVGGIRTPVTLSGKHTFQACALNHSATSPMLRTRWMRAANVAPSRLHGCTISPHKGPLMRRAISSCPKPCPNRNISLVMAASVVRSWPLTTPMAPKASLVL